VRAEVARRIAAKDYAGVAELGRTVASEVDPEWGMKILLEGCIAHDYFVLGDAYFDAALRYAKLPHVLAALYQSAAAGGQFLHFDGFRNEHLALGDAARAKGLPAVFLNTMPKSGSMYLANRIRSAYGTPPVRMGVIGFEWNYLVDARVRLLVQGGLWDQMHLDARPENLDGLAAGGITRIFLHVRDPRAAMLSWLHYETTPEVNGRNAYLSLGEAGARPAGYWQWPFAERLHWSVENTFHVWVQWSEKWLHAVQNDRRFTFLVSEFARFSENPQRTLRELTAFYGIPDGLVDMSPPSGTKDHYRKGSASAWRETYEARDLAAMASQIPPALRDAFGWLP
jgi:hypothetical protein